LREGWEFITFFLIGNKNFIKKAIGAPKYTCNIQMKHLTKPKENNKNHNPITLKPDKHTKPKPTKHQKPSDPKPT
jgi:hypothetical protein